MKNRIFPIFAIVQIFFLISMPFFSANAGITSSARNGGRQAINQFLQDDVGLTSDDYFQGVATQKKQIPEVSINFTRTDGDIFTATAQVAGMKNISEAYYTWYIRNDNYDRTNRPIPENLDNPNIANFDEFYPRSRYMGSLAGLGPDELIERYKIAATRAYIDSRFDSLRFDSEFNDNDLGDGESFGNSNGYLESDSEDLGQDEYPNQDSDEDGYIAFVGGDGSRDGGEKVSGGILESDVDNYCYIYDRSTGEPYELVGGDEAEGGFTCVDDEDKDVGGDEAEWAIECWEQEVEVEACPVLTAGDTTVNTTVTETGDGTDDNPTENSSSTTVNQEADQTNTRTLYSCNRSAGNAICLNSENLSVNPFGTLQSATSAGRCLGGGVPVCVPLSPTPQEDGFDPDDQAHQDSIDYINAREELSRQCFVPLGSTQSEIQDAQNEVIAIRENILGFDRLFEPSPSQQAALDEALGNLAEVSGEPRLTDDQVLTLTTFQAVDDGNESIDPNSFFCNWELVDGNIESLPGEAGSGRLLDEYDIKTASCSGVTCINQPTYDGDEPEFYTCDLENKCTHEIHLFPNSFGAQQTFNDQTPHISGADNGTSGFTTGDGAFGLEEEKFWGTNPSNASSVAEDLNDEMVIVGKGLMNFSWDYREGDEIGVVVEGIGVNNTRHDSQHPETVFAFMKNGCDPTAIESYNEEIRNRSNIEFLTSNMDHKDLSRCLLNNFVSPGNVTDNKNFDVELSGPTNTVVNSRSIPLLFEAIVTDEQATNDDYDAQSNALYNWRFEYAQADGVTDPDSDEVNWQSYLKFSDSTDEVNESEPQSTLYARKMDSFGVDLIKGVGLNSLDIEGNFYSDFSGDSPTELADVFIRATVEVNAPTDTTGVTRYGRAQHTFFLQGGDDLELTIKRANPLDKNATTLADADLEEVCVAVPGATRESEGYLDQVLCRTVPNEIISFEIPTDNPILAAEDYSPELVSWTLNGRKVSCNPSISSLCTQKAIIFVPTLEIGEIHNVTATYVDPSKGKDGIQEFSRNFTVVQPQIQIIPTDDDSLKYRDAGFLLNVSGEVTPDSPISQYVRTNNESFNAQARLIPSMLDDYVGTAGATADNVGERVSIRWVQPNTQNGITNADTYAEGGLTSNFVVPGHIIDERVDISAHLVVTTPTPIRSLLFEHFDVPQYESSPIQAQASAQIHDANTPIDTSLNNEQYRAYAQKLERENTSIFATAASNASEYILLLLRLVLTIGILLFIATLAMPPQTRRTHY